MKFLTDKDKNIKKKKITNFHTHTGWTQNHLIPLRKNLEETEDRVLKMSVYSLFVPKQLTCF